MPNTKHLTMARNLANASCVVLPVEGESASASAWTPTRESALSADALSGEPTEGEDMELLANGFALRGVAAARETGRRERGREYPRRALREMTDC